MRRNIFAAVVGAVMLTAMTGCQKEIEIEEKPILNYTAPTEGEEIIVISIRDMGDIKIKLFPELMPDACENFTTLAKEGYYDELIFHRVIEGFMIQGGDPKGDGTGGESCWGGKFDGGTTPQLIHLPGALCYANSGSTATNGSQFYIVTGAPMTQEDLDYYESDEFAARMNIKYDIYFPKEAEALYQEHGGAPHLDGGYTVFGQVIEGLDIVYQISQVAVNAQNKPAQAVYIDSVTVESYDGSEIHWYKSDYGIA